jgi:hypothetical protein
LQATKKKYQDQAKVAKDKYEKEVSSPVILAVLS